MARLLLTNVVMPGMSAMEPADRAAALAPALRILFRSGRTDEGIARHGVLVRRAPLTAKPFRADALLPRVREDQDGPRTGNGERKR